MRKKGSGDQMLQHVRETIYIGTFGDDFSRGKIDSISDNIEQLLGYKSADFINNPGLWSSIIHPEDISQIEKQIKDFLAKTRGTASKRHSVGGKNKRTQSRRNSLHLIYRVRHKKTRKYRWVEDVITTSHDEAGARLVGSLIDITELKESNRAKAEKDLSQPDVFEKASVGVYRVSSKGEILYANRALVKMLGFKNQKELKVHYQDGETVASRDSRKEFQRRVKSEGIVSGFESSWKKRDGTVLFVRESSHAVFGNDGNIVCYEGAVEDLTKEKLAEERIARLNRILRTLSNINQLIIRNSTPEVLFHEVCSILVKEGKYRMAWIGVLDERGGVVHPIAWDGIGDTYLKETIVIGDGKPNNFGLIGETVRTAVACVCNDLWNDPVYKSWRSEAKRKGFRSAAVFPIRVSGKVVGVVNVFADITDSFTSEAVSLLSELADDLGFALWTIEVRAKEKAANEAIKDREFWLSESQRVARVGSYILDMKAGTYTASPMLDEIFGVQTGSKHDVDSFLALVHPEDRDEFSKYFQGVLSEKKSFDFEYRIVRDNDKAERWLWGKGELMLDSAGEVTTMFGTIQDITDHKRIEEGHRRERILLRTVIDNLPSGIFVKDSDYRKTLVNSQHAERVAAHLGRLDIDSPEDILGKTDFEVYPKELAQEYFEDDRRVVRDGESILNREETVINADGRRIWFLMSKVPLRDKDGKIMGLVGISNEITQQKEAEEAAKRERILLRTVIDNIPHSIYVKDTDYRKIIANVQDVVSSGMRTEAEVYGKTDFEIFPKELAAKFAADDEAVIKQGKSITNREEFVTGRDGSVHWLLTTKVPLRDVNGNITGLVGIGTDITERKRIEELLRESEERLRSIFENASIGIYRTTPDGWVLFANPSMVRILGYDSFDDLAKYNLEQAGRFATGNPRARFRELLEASGAITGLESIQVRKDGSTFWARESAHVVRDKDGKISYYEGTLEDITDRKQAEDALERERSLLRTLIEHLPAAIFVKDKDYRKTIVNNTHLRHMVTYTNRPELGIESAILGKTDYDVYPKEEADEYFLDDQQVIRDGLTILNREERRTTANGEKGWLSISKIPLRDKAGEIIGMLGIISDVSDRKIAEEERERERNLLRTLIDNIPYPIYIKDKECRKIVANPADLLNMGLKSEAEAIGKTDFELYPRETAERFFANDQTVVREGRSILNREEYFFDRDGKKRWLLTNKIPWYDENGNIIGLVGMGADITEMKNVEDALRRSEKELRMLFESMKDIILVLDKDGRFMRVSPTEDSLLYKPGAEITGKTQRDIFPQEQAEYFLSIIRKTLESGVTQNAEYAINIRGEEKWRVATVSPLTSETVLWVARDITERKLMEKEISDSEKKYRGLVESALVGVYRTTLSGRIIYANKAMVEMLEYDSQEELTSKTSFNWYKNLKERETFTQELRIHGKTGKSMEVEFLTKTGKVKNVLISASLDGEVISGMAKDITDIRTLERQFIQTQKLEGLGNIAAGIAHDFNNLLGVILGYADLLSQSAFDQKKFQRGTQAIIKSAERGKALVKQLLTFARKTEITFSSVHVNEIVSEIEKLVEETFPKTIAVVAELHNAPPAISGDSSQIHQVLLNICVNARDAMPKGGKMTITTDVVENDSLVSKFPEAAAKKYVEIRIQDNGSGMDEETRRRIFEPFFTTKDVGKGTGLGLSVVYGIMESHRGFVDVSSEPGKGTTFSVYFPVVEESMEDDDLTEQLSEEVSGGSDTVLVIEDEEMLRDLLKTILESKGYRVLMARDGEEGLLMFRRDKDKIDVVLSDLGLPKLSGEEIVAYIKQIDPLSKVIIASGFIDPDIRTVLEASGVRDFIQKPYIAKEVLHVIRDVIDRKEV
jgi:two-component system cell cycle sensor histidine kinase/response regulator CckA